MNDNIKVINFNKNIKNNESNELDEIVFNNNNKIDNNFFQENKKNVIIEEDIALENKDLIYKDDSIYIQELENELISTYPVTKQNNKYVIEQIQNASRNIIDLKNEAIVKNDLLKKNIDYKRKLDIINNDFSDKWIIPIVSDIRKIFTNIIDINSNNENAEEKKILTQLQENSTGYEESAQKDLLEELKKNNENFEEKKININNYEEINSKLYESYKVKYNNETLNMNGYLIHPKKSYNVLRYTDLQNSNWSTHKILDDFKIPYNIYDDDGKIIGIEKNTLIKSHDLNIYGFFVLKSGNKNILNDYNNVLYKNIYSDDLNKVLYNKKNITKIYQEDKNKIKIEVDEHDINSNSIICLLNTNCYPKVDGYYNCAKDLKIIDKKTIEIQVNHNLSIDGNEGEIYFLSSLKYDYYNVDDDLNLEFKLSTYSDNEENNKHNKLYLFNDCKINKSKYNNLLKKIIPDLNQIIENEKENLEKCIYLEEVDNLLRKYKININELDYKNYNLVISYLNKNFNKIDSNFDLNQKFNDKINYFFKNREFLEKNNFYLNDNYLFDKDLIKYYGEYPYKNTNFDSITLRYNWLRNKDDYGNLFIRLLNLKNYEKSKIQIKYIENKIKQIKENINNLENIFLKEKINKDDEYKIYKYGATSLNSINVEKDEDDGYYYCDNILLWTDIHYFYDNQLYRFINNKLELLLDIEDNDLLLLNEKELWKFKDKKWEFTNEYSNYNKIEYLCQFKNIKLEELDLDSLDCVYRKDFGCLSKISQRYKIKLEEYKNNLSSFQDLLNSLKNKEKEKFIKNNINEYISKYEFSNKTNSNVKFKNLNVNIKSSTSSIPVDLLIQKINKISNINLKENYLYQLIDKDLLLVENSLYSKKYKKNVLCGHYYYLKKIYYSDNEDLRQKFIDKMISIFSDNGEVEKNSHTCKICGEKLLNNDYDETEGFASSGALIMSRERWVKEKSFDLSTESIDEYLQDIKVVDCSDDKFKELLLRNGLNIDNIDKAIDICNFITRTLYPKMGINLSNGVLINNIIEIIQKIDVIIPFNIYKLKEIKKMQQSGISKTRIDKMEGKKYFEQKFKIFYEIKKQSIICSRLLISIQVNIPNLVIKNKTTNCQFFSFNEKDGIEFFACILKEINSKMSINKEDVLKTYINFIQEYYNDFKSYFYIKELFREKKKYLLSIKKEIINDKVVEQRTSKKFDKEPLKIEDNISDKFKTIKKYDNFKTLFDKIKNRTLFVNLEIKNIIDDLIGKSELSDKLPSLLERSCCSQEISTYIDFHQYFQIFDENTKIFDYIDESKKLNNLHKFKLNNYCYHRIKLFNENIKTNNDNYPSVYNGKDASENFKKSIFLYYVDEGIYKGTLRDYVEEYKGLDNKKSKMKDIKTGKYLDEIENNEYSIDELNDLLKSIEQNNLTFFNKSNDKEEFDEEFIDKMKKESISGLNIQVNLLITNLVNLLGKTKEYENRLLFIINNMFEFEYDDNNTTPKQRINKNNSVNNMKLDYYKKLYIKISKYLSIVKNRFEYDYDKKKLNIINEPTKRSEMRSQIITENNKLASLLEPEISTKFIDIEMKYEINKINSLNGKSNKTNKNGTKILETSNFNNQEAAILMSYLIFEQLNLFFENNYDSLNKIVLYPKSSKNKYIAQFINIIMEEIDEDYELFNVCNKNDEFEHLDARFYNAYQLKIITSDQKVEIKDFLNTVSESRGISSDKEYNTLEDEIKISEERKNIEDSIVDQEKFEKIKSEYVENKDEELDLITIKQIKERIDEENEAIKEEGFINDGELKNKNILDTGSEYGSLAEFDFETGEGFPDSEYE